MLQEKIYNAGVIGAGGAGFPTHIKASASVEYLIANAAECEPMLKTDQFLMKEFSSKIVKALIALTKSVNAKYTVIAIKAKYYKQIDLLSNSIKEENANIKIHKLENFYPAGDEQSIVYEVTKRTVKALGIPLDVGCVVSNVGTLCHIYDAMQELPVTDKFISVVGEVKNPSIVHAPVGTNFLEILNKVGIKNNDSYIIDGGPMMGKYYPLQDAKNLFLTKASGGIIVLPSEHYVVKNHIHDIEKIVMLAKSACIQCSFCTDMCPRNMIGHKLHPHLVMRSISMANRENLLDNDKHTLDILKESYACSECGICEFYACPMHITPAYMNIYVKSLLRKSNIKPDRDTKNTGINPMLEFRKIPTDRLISKLGLSKYSDIKINMDNPIIVSPNVVNIRLNQHIGVPAHAIVKEGEGVTKGQLIATMEADKLGANVHASIDGVVVKIDENKIVIERGRML